MNYLKFIFYILLIAKELLKLIKEYKEENLKTAKGLHAKLKRAVKNKNTNFIDELINKL
jgi:hypothetical protein